MRCSSCNKRAPEPGGKTCQVCLDYFRTHKRTCECGNEKGSGAKACRRCAFLDGTYSAEQEVISTLRVAGGAATSAEVAAATGRSKKATDHALVRLERAGRLTSCLVDGDSCEVERRYSLAMKPIDDSVTNLDDRARMKKTHQWLENNKLWPEKHPDRERQMSEALQRIAEEDNLHTARRIAKEALDR